MWERPNRALGHNVGLLNSYVRHPTACNARRTDQSSPSLLSSSSIAFMSSGSFSRDMTCVTLARVSPSRRAMSALRMPVASISACHDIAVFKASDADLDRPDTQPVRA